MIEFSRLRSLPMQLRSIGFIPLLTTIAMGVLFFLKFQKESTETDYALQLQELIDESQFGETSLWKDRRARYFKALALLDEARGAKVDLERVLELATEELEVAEAYRPVLAAGLMRNLDLADEYGLLTAENMERLDTGGLVLIESGGFNGERVVLDNLVPHRYSPELEMRYANLLLKPESVVRRYPDQMGEGAMIVITACLSADLMTETSYRRALQAVQRSGRF